jgi:protein gp37
MAENSNIEWTDHTFNGWIGCTKISAACDNCYAENWGKRFGVEWGAGKERRLTSDAYWRKPLAWNRKAAKEGTRPKVFANSLSDVFDAEVSDEWRDRLFALIALTPNLDWLVLTKRPKVARDYLTAEDRDEAIGFAAHEACEQRGADYHRVSALLHKGHSPDGSWPLPNLWLGTTVENQAMAELRIPLLLDTPSAKRFLSCEPLIGPIKLDAAWPRARAIAGAGIDLVIAGGESGKGSRPSHPDWFRGLRDQCDAAGVPFFFKQWGDWLPWEEGSVPEWMSQTGQTQDSHTLFPAFIEDDPKWDDGLAFVIEGEPFATFQLVGKKAAGRLLDGREWSEMPT